MPIGEDPYKRLCADIILRGLKDWMAYEDNIETINHIKDELGKLPPGKSSSRLPSKISRLMNIPTKTVKHLMDLYIEGHPKETLPDSVAARYLGWKPSFVRRVYDKFSEQPDLKDLILTSPSENGKDSQYTGYRKQSFNLNYNKAM